MVTNPGTLVESMAAGWKAAGSIHNYLQGQDLKPNVEAKPVNTGVDMLPAGIVPAKRQQVPSLSAEESIQSFKKVELGFSKEQAIQEAMRCLRCRTCNRCIEETHCVGLSLAENTLKWSPYIEGNICAGCGRCARACPYNNIYLEPIC